MYLGIRRHKRKEGKNKETTRKEREVNINRRQKVCLEKRYKEGNKRKANEEENVKKVMRKNKKQTERKEGKKLISG